MKRLRVLHLSIVPVLVWDDGESLSPGPRTEPTIVPVDQLDEFPARFHAEFEQLRAEVQADAATGDEAE